MKGMLYFIAYTVLKSACFVVAKMLYNRNATLDPFQMLLMRSIFALSTQLIMVNKNLKKAVWDGVDKKSSGPLIYRSVQGSITNIINYSVTKYLPLTIIAIVNNMSPVMTVILAFFILKEKIKRFEMVMLFLTVAGVLEVVTTGEPSDED